MRFQSLSNTESNDKQMSYQKTMIGAVIGAIVAIGLILGGVYAFSGGNFLGLTTTTIGGTTNNTLSSGLGTLQISMQDPPQVPPEVTAVYINYSSIQVHVANAGNQSGWYNVTSSGTANLTSLIANSKLLGSAKLPSGTYNIVRFNVTSALVTVGGTNYTATVPSGKVQAVLTGGVDVKQGQTSSLLIAISPKVTGNTNSGYILVPSANAQPTNLSNSATSTSTTATTSST